MNRMDPAAIPTSTPRATDTSVEQSGERESVFAFPATSAQRRFWLLDQLFPSGNPALAMPIGLHWQGLLSITALQEALNQLVARHEALRTTFEPDRRQLQQLIAPRAHSNFRP